MTPQFPQVAILGTGRMGSGYALRLVDAGFSVTVWNRNPERSNALSTGGVRVAASVVDAVRSAKIILTSLANEAAFKETLLTPRVLKQLGPDHLIVDTGTIDPSAAKSAASLLSRQQVGYLDAPVSGGTVGARQGNLTIFVGGRPREFDRARPVLLALGSPHLLGPVGSGQVAKLANQVIVAITIGAVAEGLFLGERAGLQGSQLLAALRGGFADSRILREHGERMVRQNFLAGASNRIFSKDLGLIAAVAERVDASLPLTERAREAFLMLIRKGFSEEDHSSYFRYLHCVNDGEQ